MKITVVAKPKSKKVGVEKIDDSHFVVRVHEAPDDGKANKAICKSLGKYFSVAPSQVEILSGKSSRTKIIEISL